VFIAFNINHSSILPLMALNSLYCADVPLSNYSLTHSRNNLSDILYIRLFAIRQKHKHKHRQETPRKRYTYTPHIMRSWLKTAIS